MPTIEQPKETKSKDVRPVPSLQELIKKKVNNLKQPNRVSKMHMQQKLKFIHSRLGAILIGYKCRRIY